MKPATVAELRASIEREFTQIPRGLLHDVCDSIVCVVSSVWTRIDVDLRTGGDKIMK